MNLLKRSGKRFLTVGKGITTYPYLTMSEGSTSSSVLFAAFRLGVKNGTNDFDSSSEGLERLAVKPIDYCSNC